MLTVVGDEQWAILSRTVDLPPYPWLLNDCKTDDQKQHWLDCKQFFELLHLLLKDYFSGQASDLSALSRRDREFWTQYRDYWLEVYAVISDGWQEISQEAQSLELEKTEFPETPGQMLIAILKWESAALFYPCTEYASPEMAKFSPRASYNEWRKKYGQGWKCAGGKIPSGTLPKKHKSRDQLFEELQFDAFLNFCLMVCHRAAKRDRRLRVKLKSLSRLGEEIDQELYKMVHPAKAVRGHTWVNGVRRSLTKP